MLVKDNALNAESLIPTVFSRRETSVTEASQPTAHLSTYDTPLSFCINLSQPKNAEAPILVTLDGISMLVNEEQPENAETPILVTLDGISMLVNEEQPENAKLQRLFRLEGSFMLLIE